MAISQSIPPLLECVPLEKLHPSREQLFFRWNTMERGTMPAGRGQPVILNPLNTTKSSERRYKRLIWYFLAGLIGGAIGMLQFLAWCGRKRKANKKEG